MIDMKKIEEIIKEKCPNGVKYFLVKNVVKLNNYKQLGADELEKLRVKGGNIPLLPSSRNYDWYTTKEVAGDYLCEGEVFTMGRARHANVKYVKGPFVSANNFIIESANTSEVLTRYLFHFLTSKISEFYVETSTYPKFDSNLFNNLRIPIPPIDIQQKIVDTLDTFTNLIHELNAELDNRNSQCLYYKNKLFDLDCDYYQVGDVCLVTKLAGFEFTKYVQYQNEGKIIALRGLNVKNGHLNLDDVKYIDGSDLSMLTRSKLKVGDMLFTYVGTIGQVALIEENDRFYLAPNVAVIRVTNNKLLPKFLMYYFQTTGFWNNEIMRLCQSSSMQNIPMEKIRKIRVPLPDLNKQKSIVAILDKFDALVGSSEKGIPAEIELRQKQYDHYRNKLFSFKELKA